MYEGRNNGLPKHLGNVYRKEGKFEQQWEGSTYRAEGRLYGTKHKHESVYKEVEKNYLYRSMEDDVC